MQHYHVALRTAFGTQVSGPCFTMEDAIIAARHDLQEYYSLHTDPWAPGLEVTLGALLRAEHQLRSTDPGVEVSTGISDFDFISIRPCGIPFFECLEQYIEEQEPDKAVL